MATQPLPEHPNIILLITDQERATRNFPPNWEQEHMPTLTYLKAQGISFQNAFCNACMCSPSRATLMTSLYPAQHGVKDTLTYGETYSAGEIQLSSTLPNIATMLWKAGYQVYYRGKWHLSKSASGTAEVTTADVSQYGFEGWNPPESGEDVLPIHFGGGFANHDSRYLSEAVNLLRTVDRSKPFCLILSLVNPHDVLAYPQGWTYGYTEKDLVGDIDVPGTIDEDLALNYKPSAQAQLRVVSNQGLGQLSDREMQHNYVNFYGNLLSKIDGQLREVLDVLETPQGDQPPLSETTWIIRTADHGEMGLSHGGLRQKAFNVYEETINIPLVFSNPVVFPANGEERVSTQLISLIDLLPTIGGLTHVPIPDGIKGVDMSSVITENPSTDPLQSSILFTFDDIRAAFGNLYQSVAAPNRIRCVREENWKYARYFHSETSYPDEFEMYDLMEDPTEMHNLANPNHPRYNDPVVTRERNRLAQVLADREADLTKTRFADAQSSITEIQDILKVVKGGE